jgi:benzoate 4-monooxygenase
MEILKTTAVILKLFSIERTNINPTVMKEGFFNKAAECEVEIRRRDFTRENE